MTEKLNYNKLLVSLYVNYQVRHESYETGILNGINIYEKTLKKHKDSNNCFELIHACKLYKSFLRLTCNELNFVRKVESLINRRIPDSEGQINENAWSLAQNQLTEEQNIWSTKLTESSNSQNLVQNGTHNIQQTLENGIKENNSDNSDTELKKRSFPGDEDPLEAGEKKLEN